MGVELKGKGGDVKQEVLTYLNPIILWIYVWQAGVSFQIYQIVVLKVYRR